MKPQSSYHPLEPPASGEGHTFLVLPGGECVPVDGPLHVEALRGDWFVVGESCWERFETPDQARECLEKRIHEASPHGIAARALSDLELIPRAGSPNDA